MQRPPVRINVHEHSLFGLTYRQTAWLAGSGLGALAVFFSLLSGADLVARGGAAVLVIGLGASVAFGVIDGQLPEVWLWHCLAYARRSRYLVKGARQAVEPQAVLDAGDRPEAAPAPARAVVKSASTRLITWPMGAVTASLLAGLALYLYSGGAARLAAIWNGL